MIFFSIFSALVLQAGAMNLQSGDVLLQAAECSLCPLIEKEEGLPYSHTGVILLDSQGTPTVLESWNSVKQISLPEFLAKRRTGKTLVMRPTKTFINAINLQKVFKQKYEGHTYDSEFLWDNIDSRGEKLYCSEFVVKILNEFLPESIRPKPMHYLVERARWIEYFGGTPPDGLPGVSPADLARTPALKAIGTLN